MKLVSIVLPTYNGERWISQSIESILNQSYKNIEIIIVDDCSKDRTLHICEEYAKKDKRIKIIHNEVNQKLPRSLNIGFEQAHGDYYTWTSDDNWYELNAIEQMVDYLELHSNDAMVVANYDQVKNNRHIIINPNPTPENMINQNSVGACFLYRATVAKLVGKYNENRFLVEDYDYWLRINLIGNIGKLEKVLYHYLLHSNSLTCTRAKEIRIATFSLIKEMLPLYLEKFNNISYKKIQKKINLYEFLYNKDSEKFNLIKRDFPIRELYKKISNYYEETADIYYLTYIKKLGIKYKLKSIFLKQRVSKRNNKIENCVKNSFR